ncbi:RHS repeat-associated core domain-containing protein [Riemerella anatipestifer]|uniref:RHS repeat-associated core domain-containing protein n=1 Tax=Riemerella anatipestifer TaxID=34085 RepID=UPI001374EAFD|nr:RHS repeat-associated core domain-containing protein [Riemerella anatipestifer]
MYYQTVIKRRNKFRGFFRPTTETRRSDDGTVHNKKRLSEWQFLPTSEGYYDYLHKRYVYYYTDHLGNVRLSYYRSNNGNLTIDKESNYYPFGLEHTGYNGLLGNQSYNYKYNGKELQTEIGMYDYGARFYMPDLGRWGVVDPLAEETMELYSYVKNNPIMLIDPTGMEAEDPEDPPKKSKYIGQIYKDGTGTFVGGKDGSWNATRNDGSKETIIPEVIITKSNSGDFVKNTLDKVGNVNDVIDNTGSSLQANSGLTRLGSNRKLYFETLNGGVFKGNQYVSTISVAKYGSKMTRITGPIGHTISVGQIGYGIYKDGGDFGNNAKIATGGVAGGTIGGIGGAWGGAKFFGAIGLFIGGPPGGAIGGVLGGIVGGVAGGYYGGEYGEQLTKEYIKK